LILCYHGVSERWPSDFALSPRRLERQLRHLLGRGYRPLTLGAALRERPGGRTLAVTFDDALRSVLSEGEPVLSRLGVPATVFVPTRYVTTQEPVTWPGMEEWLGTPHERELDCMTWDELRGLRDLGWEIGSHTRSHPDLRTLDDDEVGAEMTESRRECERELERSCELLAYPFSSYDRRVKGLARAAGYSAAVILDNRIPIPPRSVPLLPDSDPFELVRAGVYRHDGWARFLAKTSAAARRARSTRALQMAIRTDTDRVSS
jgi:peptidoglycan/xylan/chitin deacetylase (PgdA/CDA1 family)